MKEWAANKDNKGTIEYQYPVKQKISYTGAGATDAKGQPKPGAGQGVGQTDKAKDLTSKYDGPQKAEPMFDKGGAPIPQVAKKDWVKPGADGNPVKGDTIKDKHGKDKQATQTTADEEHGKQKEAALKNGAGKSDNKKYDDKFW